MALGRPSSSLSVDTLIYGRQERRHKPEDLVREEVVEDLEEAAFVCRRSVGPTRHL